MKTFAAIILGLFFSVGMAFTTQAQVGVAITIGPPVIPVYTQPPCPTDGYLWTPGYWAYDYDDNVYYWVPGVWIAPPEVGFLWTPGYWGFDGGHYLWHGGYWGPHVGFYGGINYGFGYVGTGFYGGRWDGGAFHYNTTVWHVNNTVIHNTYTAAAPAGSSHVAFNGKGGVTAQPTASEKAAMSEHHTQPTASQQSHEKAMSKDKNQWASVNKGKPATTAMSGVNGQKFNSSGNAAEKTAAAHTTTTNHTATPASHSAAPASHSATSASHSAAPASHSAPATHAASPPAHSAPTSHPIAPASHNSAPATHAAPAHSAPAPQHNPAPQQRPQNMHPVSPPHNGGGAMHGGGGGERHR